MDDQQSSGNARFVCPSDRQLMLRGRLKTGWCTGAKAKSTGTLSSEEQDLIVSVIKRNDAIEMAERQRVGRLVDKLERIRERIVDSGPNQCRLCGHVFRFLRSPKVICEDCQKPVCSKCCIDLIVRRPAAKQPLPPPVERNNNNNNNNSQGTKLTAVAGTIRSISSATTSTTPVTTATTTVAAVAAAPTISIHILCKVCSLTREIWKKSGAWFYKGIPKYDLPPAPTQQPQFRPAMTMIRLQGNLNSSSDEDTDDDDVFRLFKSSRHRKRVLDTTSLVSNDTQSTNGSSLLETQSLRSQAMISGGMGVGGDTDSLYSAVSCAMVRNSSNDSIREASVGWLEVVLSYNKQEEVMHCSIIRARDLRPMDANGLSDPFCKLNLVSAEGNCRQVNWSRTKTVHKTRNPEFNESITFAGVCEENLLTFWLYVVLLDDDKYGHDFIGTAKINLAMMADREAHRISVPLEAEDIVAGRAIYEGPWLRGQILVALCYNTKRRALLVLIKECTNLISMDNNGFSDPFVKVHLKPDGHKRKFRTNIKWRNLNPVFNEEFAFETRPNDLDKQTLVLSVWDKDIGKSNDFLGSLILGGSSKGRRLKQWRDCIRLPDHYHEQWHCLAAVHDKDG